MPSYTTSLRLIQPATGEYSGTWGTQVNDSLTALVDKAVAGTTSITMTAANYTLTNANGVADEAKSMFLVLGGTPGASYQVIVPTASKLYFVTNSTGFAQTVKTSGGSGISVPNGASMTLRCDGTNVVVAENYFGSLTLGAALPTGSGGTGLTSFTSGGVVYASSTSALATGSGLVFDGTNLGIGTSSPGNPLDVTKAGIQIGSTTAYSVGCFRDATPNKGVSLGYDSGSQTGIVLAQTASASSNLAFWTYESGGSGWAERMRLDSSGNLGLGVTPSAQGVYRTMQFGDFLNIGQQTTGTSQAFFGWNVRGSSTQNQYLYNRTGDKAALYEIHSDASHRWSVTNTSGTAGNTISFTQAMTLDASGNLGLGVTPSAKLDVNGSAKFGATISTGTGVSTGDANIELGGLRTGDGPSFVDFHSTSGTDYESRLIRQSGVNGRLEFQNSGTGEMWLLQTGASSIIFFTNNTERARITSGGELLVGTTTTPSSSNAGFILAKDADGTYLRNACTITTTRTHFEFVNGNGTVGSISTNGSATAFTTSSDRRLKENIQPAADAAPVIDAIEIVQHDWKAGGHTRFGVIAQDLHAVAPEAVTPGDDGDEIEKTWGVDYSKLVPMLIKEIQSLRARVAQLESKA